MTPIERVLDDNSALVRENAALKEQLRVQAFALANSENQLAAANQRAESAERALQGRLGVIENAPRGEKA